MKEAILYQFLPILQAEIPEPGERRNTSKIRPNCTTFIPLPFLRIITIP